MSAKLQHQFHSELSLPLPHSLHLQRDTSHSRSSSSSRSLFQLTGLSSEEFFLHIHESTMSPIIQRKSTPQLEISPSNITKSHQTKSFLDGKSTVEIKDCSAEDSDLNLFLQSLVNTTVTSLNISGCSIGITSLKSLGLLLLHPNCTISSLFLLGNKFPKGICEILGEAIKGNKSLVSFALEGTGLGSLHVHSLLADVKQNTGSLKAIDVKWTKAGGSKSNVLSFSRNNKFSSNWKINVHSHCNQPSLLPKSKRIASSISMPNLSSLLEAEPKVTPTKSPPMKHRSRAQFYPSSTTLTEPRNHSQMNKCSEQEPLWLVKARLGELTNKDARLAEERNTLAEEAKRTSSSFLSEIKDISHMQSSTLESLAVYHQRERLEEKLNQQRDLDQERVNDRKTRENRRKKVFEEREAREKRRAILKEVYDGVSESLFKDI